MDNPFENPEQARDEILADHDLQADAEEAYTLLEEATELWDDLEHSGRIARLRKAGQILDRTLKYNSWRVEREADAEHHCPHCGNAEFDREDIGAGQGRVYCTACDGTIQVG